MPSLLGLHAPRQFASGHQIFREGDSGQEMYVIQSGSVRISQSVGAEEKTLSVLQRGDFFGEMSLLGGESRSAHATVVEPARLLVVDHGTFDAMLHEHPDLAVRMVKGLAERLRATNGQVKGLLLDGAAVPGTLQPTDSSKKY